MRDQQEPLWGKPPRRGMYERCDYSGPGRFGPREAGSTFATSMLIQPVILSTSAVLESYATQADPSTSGVAVFTAAYFLQLATVIGFKVLANLLRNYGTSWARDFGAWLWEILAGWFRGKVWQELTGWIPGRERRQKRRERRKNGERPILDWLFPRRRRRNRDDS